MSLLSGWAGEEPDLAPDDKEYDSAARLDALPVPGGCGEPRGRGGGDVRAAAASRDVASDSQYRVRCSHGPGQCGACERRRQRRLPLPDVMPLRMASDPLVEAVAARSRLAEVSLLRNARTCRVQGVTSWVFLAVCARGRRYDSSSDLSSKLHSSKTH